VKILYFGGQKSGKTSKAQQKALKLSRQTKPYYIATYNNNYNDKAMKNRIKKHKIDRADKFITIEQATQLLKVLKPNQTYIIDCLSMWIFNNINKTQDNLLSCIDQIFKIEANIIFVLNDVGNGVIPMEHISRKFVDLSGIIGQKVAMLCDEVYEVKMGIAIQIK
jgi:adenosylcobinamide kinase/adenosylcobinamide-phosphate guanylyltransferase